MSKIIIRHLNTIENTTQKHIILKLTLKMNLKSQSKKMNLKKQSKKLNLKRQSKKLSLKSLQWKKRRLKSRWERQVKFQQSRIWWLLSIECKRLSQISNRRKYKIMQTRWGRRRVRPSSYWNNLRKRSNDVFLFHTSHIYIYKWF